MQGAGFNYSQMHIQHKNNVIGLYRFIACADLHSFDYALIFVRAKQTNEEIPGKSQTVTQHAVNNASEVIGHLHNSGQ